MTESELTWVTNHLGHTKDIHKGWYRQEDSTIELTKIAKVLIAIDNGDSRDVQNKKIDTLMASVNDSCMLHHNFDFLFNQHQICMIISQTSYSIFFLCCVSLLFYFFLYWQDSVSLCH